MWGSVLVFGVISSIEAQRIGIAAILVGFPRPMRNLFAFWVGLMISGSAIALVGALLLRDYLAPILGFLARCGSMVSTPPVKIGFGVLALCIAAMLVSRSSVRQTAAVPVPTPVPVLAAHVLESPPADFESVAKAPSSFAARALAFATGRCSWSELLDKGSTKLAFVAGLSTSAPPLEFWGAVLAILASRATVGAQVAAFLVFMLASYAVAEIPLVCHLVWPVKTRAVVMQLQGWLRAHTRAIFASLFGAFGLLTVIGGLAGL